MDDREETMKEKATCKNCGEPIFEGTIGGGVGHGGRRIGGVRQWLHDNGEYPSSGDCSLKAEPLPVGATVLPEVEDLDKAALEAALRDPALESLGDGPLKEFLTSMAARLEYQGDPPDVDDGTVTIVFPVQFAGAAEAFKAALFRDDLIGPEYEGERVVPPHKRRGGRP